MPTVNLSAASATVTASTRSEYNILENRTALKNKIKLQLLVVTSSILLIADKRFLKKIKTFLMSSAPVERIFSFATLVNSLRRHGLSDKLFEKLVLLKSYTINNK